LSEFVHPSGSRSAAGSNPGELPDVPALTRAMTKGDEMAYRTFYGAYFDRLLRYLLVVARGDEEAAREALQSALVRVARHIRVFQDEAAFWSWLTVLARSAFADERRKRGRYFAFLERFRLVAATEQMDKEADDSLRALLEQKLKALPCEDQELMRRKYFEHRPVRELAAALQTTGKAIESRLSRIRRKLKEAVLAELKNERPG